jgi:beta-aspartyl-peptidase (threonine type)
MRMLLRTLSGCPLPLLAAAAVLCAPAGAQAPPAGTPAPGRAEIVLQRDAPARWALAIHGGAGVIPKSLPEAEKREYYQALEAALKLGRDALAGGATSLDTVEKVVRFLEDDPRFNAGKGAVFTHDGTHELDAAIMDGRDLTCGSVARLKTVRNPVSLARLVMERSPHVFLVGDGAESFADTMKVERVAPEWFDTPRRRAEWEEALAKERAAAEPSPDRKRGTVGAAALDVHGNLAAATSTGGMTNKRWGRLGDVPVIGAGTYANNRTAALSATGWGEKFIRYTVTHDISAMMEYGGLTLQQAADKVIHGKLNKGDGGIIGVSHDGSIALVFNSEGMFRGAADAGGRFEVAIWE